MKKFTKKIALFTLLIIIIINGINYQLRKNITLHYEKVYEEVFNPTKDIDAIILGTSHAGHGIIPSVLDSTGHSFYNFSYNGSNPEFYFDWYTNAFSPYHEKPKYCIYAVDWYMFDPTIMTRKYEQDSEYFPFELYLDNMKNSEMDRPMMLKNRLPIVKYNTLEYLKHIFVKKTDYGPYKMDRYNDGYLPFEGDRKMGNNPFETKVDTLRIEQFEAFIKVLQEDGIKIIFVNVPEYGGDWEKYKKIPTVNYLSAFAKEYDIPYLNYNTTRRLQLNNHPEYFTNWVHLNHLGSRKFSHILKEDLEHVFNKE